MNERAEVESDGSENADFVEDPFIDAQAYVPPKKASLKALLSEDPRVLATAIEDERINDIYFTSKAFLFNPWP